jgi:hypothetical protein
LKGGGLIAKKILDMWQAKSVNDLRSIVR